MPRKSRFSPDIFEAWRVRYEEGMSTKKIGAVFGVAGGTVYDRLKCMGVIFRSPSESRQVYTINERVFDVIETEASAYWLGFLFADGCVLQRGMRRHVALWLKDEDCPHLKSFSAFLSSTYPILHSKVRKASGISVSSVHLFNRLVELGCTPRKSLVVPFPMLPQRLVHHFVRGYFDGDGSAFLGDGTPTISFVGGRAFLEAIKDAIDTGTSRNGRLYPHSRSRAWYLVYRGEFKVAAVKDWLYRDASTRLARKWGRLASYSTGKRKGYPVAYK